MSVSEGSRGGFAMLSQRYAPLFAGAAIQPFDVVCDRYEALYESLLGASAPGSAAAA